MHFLIPIRTAINWIIYLPIVGSTYLLVWLDRKLQFKLPFPRHLDELGKSQEWCVKELKGSGALPANADVKQFKVKPLNQELIFRSNAGVITIEYSTGGEVITLRCFAKFAPIMGTVWNKAVFNLQFNHVKEYVFNEFFVKENPSIPAPKVYVSKVGFLTGHLCLITEMMDDSMEYLETIHSDISEEHLQLVLSGLATLHAAYWKSTAPVMKKIMPIENSTVYLFDSMVLFSWSRQARKILRESWMRMNEPETILHGDARIGNMLFPKPDGTGRFVFIDWQAVRKGKGVYDLAYFVLLSLLTEHRVKVEVECLDKYLNYLAAKGVKDYSREMLEEDYRHACLCVLLLLSLPMLSGEVSAEGTAAELFAWGMGVWHDRLQAKFSSFDYQWMARQYGLSEKECRDAVAEMLLVISDRIKKIERERLS